MLANSNDSPSSLFLFVSTCNGHDRQCMRFYSMLAFRRTCSEEHQAGFGLKYSRTWQLELKGELYGENEFPPGAVKLVL